ncbi:unnamed protein product [Cylindrotheca closterium]|uniref:Hexosyltransferase n=1 Tax=Cylindrotheca closterium TaxID=2856 RepID=A0AAD2JNW1_9STRA|nr:unnamed protein product [Cylindrotheca closterium]
MAQESSRNGKSTFIVAFLAFIFGMSFGSMRNVNKSFFDVPMMEGYFPTTVSSVTEVNDDDISFNQTMTDDDMVNILYTLSGNDPGFLSEFSTSLKSVLMNSPLDKDLTIHLVSDEKAHAGIQNILYGEESGLNEIISRNQINIRTYNVQKYIKLWQVLIRTKTNSTVNQVHTMGTYFRLFAHEILPKDVEHIIYMDTDIAIMSNLEQVWRLRDDTVLFQWGRLRCAGFLLINLPKFGARFWDLVTRIEKEHSLQKVSKTKTTNDQLLLQAVQKIYPDQIGRLPPDWDIHVGSGVYAWKTRDKVLRERPRAGFIHLNGGSHSKASAFDENILVTGAKFNRTWLVAQYYATYPWQWAKFNLESQAIDGKGVPIDIEYSPI